MAICHSPVLGEGGCLYAVKLDKVRGDKVSYGGFCRDESFAFHDDSSQVMVVPFQVCHELSCGRLCINSVGFLTSCFWVPPFDAKTLLAVLCIPNL